MTGRRTVLRRASAWLLVALLAQPLAPFALAQDAPAGDGAALLEAGRQQYDDLEWEDAVGTLLEALDSDLSPTQLADAYWLLALTTRALDDLEAAENYLYELIRVNPDFALPATAVGTDFEPLLAAALGRADRVAPTVDIASPEDVERGKPVRIVAQVSDASPVAEVSLSFRIPGARENTVLAMVSGDDDGRWTGEIPAAATNTPGSLAFVVSAKDEWQNVASQRATLVVPKGGGNGFLYIVLAVLAAGGGLAAAALGGGGDGGVDDGPGGTPTWPTSSPPGPPL